MRVMLMHKTNPANEAGIRPSAELIAGVSALIGEMVAANLFRAGEGLRATSLGVRVRRQAGNTTTSPGPFTGANEFTAALCVMRVSSLDEAVNWANRFLALVGEGEIDIRPVTEPWDLGLAEKPRGDPSARYMALHKASAIYQSGILPPAELRGAIAALIEEMKSAGSFVTAEALQPGSKSRRLRKEGGKAVILDGPFTESKELIAGYMVLEVPSIEAALPWASRYSALLDDAEVDVRPLFELPQLR